MKPEIVDFFVTYIEFWYAWDILWRIGEDSFYMTTHIYQVIYIC